MLGSNTPLSYQMIWCMSLSMSSCWSSGHMPSCGHRTMKDKWTLCSLSCGIASLMSTWTYSIKGLRLSLLSLRQPRPQPCRPQLPSYATTCIPITTSLHGVGFTLIGTGHLPHLSYFESCESSKPVFPTMRAVPMRLQCQHQVLVPLAAGEGVMRLLFSLIWCHHQLLVWLARWRVT